MASGQKSVMRNKSGLKKNRSLSGSLFRCTSGQPEDSAVIDNLEFKLAQKTREIDELKTRIKILEEALGKVGEVMENTTILHKCKNVMHGDGVLIVEEMMMDTEKLDLFIETVRKTLNSVSDDKRLLEATVRRLEETLANVESKMNVMETHFSDLNATLTREFKKAATRLMQHNVDIADQFSNLRTIFQRFHDNKLKETDNEEDERKIEAGINSIREWVSPTADVTASTLPIPAKKLHRLLTSKYGKIPVELELLFTSRTMGYYVSPDTFDNTVAKWLVGWVRDSSTNTADVLQRELASLNKIVDIISDSED